MNAPENKQQQLKGDVATEKGNGTDFQTASVIRKNPSTSESGTLPKPEGVSTPGPNK